MTRQAETSVDRAGPRLARRPRVLRTSRADPVAPRADRLSLGISRSASVPVACRSGVVRSVAHWAGNRATPLAIQRWSADEHKRLGDVTGLRVDIGDGVELTFGQVVALAGDEFGSLDDLMAATRTGEGRARIRAHLERAGLPGPVRGTLPAPATKAEQEKQAGQATSEYVALAADNSSHFAGGGTAVEEWLRHHFQAVDQAMKAGLAADEGLLNRARLTEAFGAHFLTDAFSSGHIRVPRQAITDYYVGDLAPKVYDHLVAFVTDHLIDGVNDQVYRQQPWYLKPLRGERLRRIQNAVRPMVTNAIASAGGRAKVAKVLGLALAGIVAGAMHDAENRDGLMVVSKVHPDPWKAFGDNRLDADPKHKAQVEAALKASVTDLASAYAIGQEQHQDLYNLPEPTSVPTTVYFELGQWTATPATTAAVESLALYCRYHPETNVALTGHTDPLGSDADNEALGAGRAAAVYDILVANGVGPDRITMQSYGEKALVTRNPRYYARNRRVEISLGSDPGRAAAGETPEDIGARQVQQKLTAQVGPPYAAEDHFPRAAPGLNAELPDWHWGSIKDPLRTEMQNWIVGYLRHFRGDILARPELAPRTVEGYLVEPQVIVRDLLATVERDPIGFLGQALGTSAD